jgi:hypothetical protein
LRHHRAREHHGAEYFLNPDDLIWSVLTNKLNADEWGKVSLSVGTNPDEIKAPA